MCTENGLASGWEVIIPEGSTSDHRELGLQRLHLLRRSAADFKVKLEEELTDGERHLG
jgi:hypothetical protein